MNVLYRDGLYLPDCDLYLDPHHARESAIVTHAHSDHMGWHKRVFSTAATAAMMRVRGLRRCDFQPLEWGEVVEMGGAEVTLVPAGHVLGSAQVLVESNGERLLYSGDFKLRPGLSAETAVVPPADILVMETTFGLPRYRFPPTEEVFQNIKLFCRDGLDHRRAPVLFCYSLGKGQEVLAGLAGADFPIYLHENHYEMSNLYRAFGVRFPPYALYEPGRPLDGVLLCAPGSRKSRWFVELERAQSVRTAYISGWALDPGAAWRYGTHDAFPLSDHADYEELMHYVRLSGARRIYTTHGFAAEFAADLRHCGFDASPL